MVLNELMELPSLKMDAKNKKKKKKKKKKFNII